MAVLACWQHIDCLFLERLGDQCVPEVTWYSHAVLITGASREGNGVLQRTDGKEQGTPAHRSMYLHFASQGAGLQPEASGSFLKGMVLTKERAKYRGSFKIIVTTR
jgi:hypothetical protein